jgi:hypothetical protein
VFAHIALLMLALWTVWQPAETTAATPTILALAVLALVPWAHARTDGSRLWWGIGATAMAAGALGFSAAGGWDRSTAVAELALLAVVVALVWVASREEVPQLAPGLVAAGIALLALWALWQVTVGFDRAQEAVATLPLVWQANAAERLASGRAFASQLLPGHLAVLFATALPLLLAPIRRSGRRVPWAVAACLCVLGLVLTRSPIGIGLAGAAMVVLLARRRTLATTVTVVVLAAVLLLAVVWRPDVGELEPVRLRTDNWRTAVWAWTTSPVAGVGFGSFGQAIQAVPFEVGNRPAHAHNLPLEWLAELGLAGGVGWLLAAVWLARLLRRLWPTQPELAVALAVVPFHNLVDFSIFTSGVAIPWAVLLGWGISVDRSGQSAAADRTSRVLLVTVATLAVAGCLLHATSVTLERSAVAAPSALAQFEDARAAHRFAPWRVQPIAVAAAAAIESGERGRLDEAAGLLRSGRWLRPRSAMLAEAAGRIDLARGRVPTGVSWIRLAAELQPASDARRGTWESLEERLEEEFGSAGR